MTTMWKRLAPAFLLLLVLACVSWAAPGSIRVVVDGTEVKLPVPATQSGSQVVVPLKPVLEALGVTCWWEPSLGPGRLTAYKGSIFVTLQAGSSMGTLQGGLVSLDVPSSLQQGWIMGPASLLSRTFGASVVWDEGSRTLTVASGPGDPPLTGKARALVEALEAAGYEVRRGAMAQLNLIDLCTWKLLPSCYGNNAGQPYLCPLLPVGATQDFPNTFPWTYRLEEREGVVILGNTPPEADYFSYRGYLTLRTFRDEGTRRRVFASLGDEVNVLSFPAGGGSPFRHDFALVSTADRNLDGAVRQAAAQAGYSAFLSDTIPKPLVRMGLAADADEFGLINRAARFKDKAAGQAYLANPDVEVFRVTPRTSGVASLFGMPNLRIRGTGVFEEAAPADRAAAGGQDLLETMTELRRAILNRYGVSRDVEEMETCVWLPEGFEGIQRGIDVLGEGRDTIYLRTSGDFLLKDDPEDFVIVYGVLHNRTGKATYTNLSVYGTRYLNGVCGMDNDRLAGTAEEYLPGNPLAKYLYVAKISRRQLDAGTNVVPWGVGCNGVDLKDSIFLAFRAYLEPPTKVGPAAAELIFDRGIHFRAPSGSSGSGGGGCDAGLGMGALLPVLLLFFRRRG